MQREYASFKNTIWLDPAAGHRNQVTDHIQFKVWQDLGLPVRLAPTNKPTIIIEAVKKMLNTLRGGLPSLLVTPKAAQLRKGLAGGYKYRRIMTSGNMFTDEPAKNKYSHVCDAAGYAVNGLGMGKELMGNSKFKELAQSGKNFSGGKGFKR